MDRAMSSEARRLSGDQGVETREVFEVDWESLEEEELAFPGFAPVVLRCFSQETRPRNWCLRMITNPWFERVSMTVILVNCVTLGMYRPCLDEKCESQLCQSLQIVDHLIFVFFAVEMVIKMIAMGMWGRGTYLADSWNRLDCFIVVAGALEYCLNVENMNLSAIRTIRVLRPLRAINRIPSMRILVMLLLDTLPMLGNVLLLCFFVFFIFGIVGVQLWKGILRQRCFIPQNFNWNPNINCSSRFDAEPIPTYYYRGMRDFIEKDYICSTPKYSGMHTCDHLPLYRSSNGTECNATLDECSSCVNFNYYYTDCRPGAKNPFQGAISFDNIGLAWVAIFLVISLEAWTDIMYYVQDAHSFWVWIYFVLLIVIGSFFMLNLCLVVIATQFSETKKREMEKMKLERARFHSTSTLASGSFSESASCYTQILKYIAHLYRRTKRRFWRKYKRWRRNRENRGIALHRKRARRRPAGQKGKPREEEEEEEGAALTGLCDLPLGAPRASPEVSDIDLLASPRRPILVRVPSVNSPSPHSGRRRSSVMFCDMVTLHSEGHRTVSSAHLSHESVIEEPENVVEYEPSKPPQQQQQPKQRQQQPSGVSSKGSNTSRSSSIGKMTCRELIALTGAMAALPAGAGSLPMSVYAGLARGPGQRHFSAPTLAFFPVHPESDDSEEWSSGEYDDADDVSEREWPSKKRPSRFRVFSRCWTTFRKYVKMVVEHPYFNRSILFAILINTLSMGVEYHEQARFIVVFFLAQPKELTVAVEMSNLVFSCIFALEMLLKLIAFGIFGYLSDGFNVFDGAIVILSLVELWQSGDGVRQDGSGGGSGLSVLRTFRLLRILKLVRFLPNLRRQLFVMLRTMDNVAVFFALLILFIFIFSVLGMYLFGGKFCVHAETEEECKCSEIHAPNSPCVCDRKNFNTFLWATVTVFMILTQEDWNIVLFNAMEKTSHWAALYFVALMTFGNYVLFNLLVAILVEGFSSEKENREARRGEGMTKIEDGEAEEKDEAEAEDEVEEENTKVAVTETSGLSPSFLELFKGAFYHCQGPNITGVRGLKVKYDEGDEGGCLSSPHLFSLIDFLYPKQRYGYRLHYL
ncbi:unnamed protein product [Darwinula stevensoni]|uniref:Ion transport domain-containing protein n=1 Tax=Darwinula stevensoni TaxID=69355 RepID=A0A7R9A829_9CRUS|nr:unnamed protein product [Darwinula stevensoni]CAG0894816.1 unnamed protein product [Darwinula stevensoni]